MATNPARYTVEHETLYKYAAPVSQSRQLAHLKPRELPWQRLLSHAVIVEPEPDELHEAVDSFGNEVTHFALHRAHQLLRVTLRCTIEVGERPRLPRSVGGTSSSAPEAGFGRPDALPAASSSAAAAGSYDATTEASWEAVRDSVRRRPAQDGLVPARMCEPTRLVPLSDAACAYAAAVLQPGRDWLDAVIALMRTIHREFRFKPGATTVSTSVDEVLAQRNGVCQDFAHLMLACLRGHGLPARYVSGYLLTNPPPGRPRLLGADATHAWVAAWSPRHGWVELDPTNDQFADSRYITLAWGADFADVVPVRGVIYGGGEQKLDVKVSVIPESERPLAPPVAAPAAAG